MSQIQQSVDVDVTVRVAYNQWTQFESFPHVMSGVESITQVDDRRNHWVTNIAGVKREFDTEITEQHPDERIAWRSVGGDTEHAGVVTFHRLSDTSTRVMIQIDWQPSSVAEKVGSAINVDEIQVKQDAERFKNPRLVIHDEDRGNPSCAHVRTVAGEVPTGSRRATCAS